jgi:hypothetical protein
MYNSGASMTTAAAIERGHFTAFLSHEDLSEQDITDLQALAANQALPFEVSLYQMSDGQIGARLFRSDDLRAGPRFAFSRHGKRVLVVYSGMRSPGDSSCTYRTMAGAIADVADALFHFLSLSVGVPDPEFAMVTRH